MNRNRIAFVQGSRRSGVIDYSVRRVSAFACLSDDVVRDLDDAVVPMPQVAGAVLYSQNDKPLGVYLLFNGKAKLTAVVATGKTALLRISQSGELLGLNAAMAKRPHMATARMIEDSQVGLIRREDLLNLMARHPQLALAVAERLATDCAEALTEMLFLRVTTTTLQRLAMLILRWSGATNARRHEIPILYTQAEIGQMIGASRETVTRLMKQLERKGNISISHSQLKIVDQQSMKKIARIAGRISSAM